MKTYIKTRTLKASIYCAAVKDVRYYLQGVHLHFRHEGITRVEVVSTDGNIMSAFIDTMEYIEDAQTADWSIIIPIDVVKKVSKVKKAVVILESLPDGRYMLDDTVFAPVDGRYPDYRRVIPNAIDAAKPNPDTDRVQIDPDLMVRCADALLTYTGATKRKLSFQIDHFERASVMHCGENNAVCVVMPYRHNGLTYQGLMR